jgi:hypothetical protein
METKHVIKLIDGNFHPKDAARVLMQLISDKINYHNVEMLSIYEHFNGDVSHSVKRINELSEAKESLRELLERAEQEGFDLVVESNINIKLVKA